MATLHSLLAVYGSIDTLIARHEPMLAATVAKFMPGTTGQGQVGWFNQIEEFVRRLKDDEDVEFPSVSEALDAFAKAAIGGDDDDDALSAPQLGRLLYAVGMLSRLPADVVDEHLFISDEQLAAVLALAAPVNGPNIDCGRSLLRLLRQEFTDRQHWSEVMQLAESQGLVSGAVASIGPPCVGTVKRFGRQYCARVTTDFIVDGLTVDSIKPIIDPLNWADSGSPSFFCRMTELSPTVDANGWSRVMEHGSTDCRRYQLKTALKYWKAELDGGIIINYDVDDDRANTEDNGMVVFDNGYLWVVPSDPTGVRIRTSKEFLIHGLSPAASAVFACVLGWADIARQWFSQSVTDKRDDAVGWAVSTPRIDMVHRAAPRYGDMQRRPALPADARRELIDRSLEAAGTYLNAWRGTGDSRDRLG
jgi:hypothetical protein